MSKIAYHRQDNWNHFGYESRYLDALASLLHVQTDVTAVLEENNIIYLSYNSNVTTQNKKCVSLIQNLLTNLDNHSNDHLLGIYLIFNVDFINLVKKSRNHVDETGKDLLEKFIFNHEKASGSLNKNINTVKNLSTEELGKYYTNQIVSNYKEIIDYFSVNKDLNSHLNTFLRPLQDSYKLYYYLKDTNTRFDDLIVLENPNSIHSDCNIADFFKSSKYLDKNYVGVSRLCCGYCHKYLEEGSYAHRGTHGVCDEKWKMISPLEKKFKESVEPILEFDQNNQPIQYRRLSIDNFEKSIFIKQSKSLYNLKKEIDLVKEGGFKGYIFFEGKTVPCYYTHIDSYYEEVLIGENSFLYHTIGYFGID